MRYVSKDTWARPGKTALADSASSSRRPGRRCSRGRCRIRPRCMECSYLLSGTLPDQAALHGVLLQIIRLGLTLLSLETSEAPNETGDDL